MILPSSPETRLRSMTGLFITRGDEILLLWKPSGRAVRQVWCPSAGGHVEPDEYRDPLACVLRELKEETGLTRDCLTGLSLRYLTIRAGDGELRQKRHSGNGGLHNEKRQKASCSRQGKALENTASVPQIHPRVLQEGADVVI